MQIDTDFQKAVNGWKQAVGIIRKLKPSLEFALEELARVNQEHPYALGESKEKAVKFHEAASTVDLAESYISAMDKAGQS